MRKIKIEKSFSFEDTLFSFLKCFVFSFVLFVVTIPFLELYMKEYINIFFSVYLLCSFILSYSLSKRKSIYKTNTTSYKQIPSLFIQYDINSFFFLKKAGDANHTLLTSINQDYLFIQNSLSVLSIEEQHALETVIQQDLYYVLSSYLQLSDEKKQKEKTLLFSSLQEVQRHLSLYKEKIDHFYQTQLYKRNLLLKKRG